MRSQPTPAASGLASILPEQPAGSLALAAAVAATAQPARPDAVLIDLGQQWADVLARDAHLDAREDVLTSAEWLAQAKVHCAERATIAAAAAAIHATNPAGLAVKARILAYAADCPADDDAGIAAWAFEVASGSLLLDQAVGSLVADILRLAAEAGR